MVLFWFAVLLAIAGLLVCASRDLTRKKKCSEPPSNDYDKALEEWAKEEYHKRFVVYSGLLKKKEQLRKKFNEFCENYNRLIKDENSEFDPEEEKHRRFNQYQHHRLQRLSDLYDAEIIRFQAYYDVICFIMNNLYTNAPFEVSVCRFTALDFVLGRAQASLQIIESNETEYAQLYSKTK